MRSKNPKNWGEGRGNVARTTKIKKQVQKQRIISSQAVSGVETMVTELVNGIHRNCDEIATKLRGLARRISNKKRARVCT
jgi:hypothetical protein